MIKKRILSQIATLLLLIHFLVPAPLVAQEPPITKVVTWTLPTLAKSDTLRLEGYRPRVTLDFLLPSGWRPSAFSTSGQLTLDYRISNLARPGATLTVRFNGETLYSTSFKAPSGALTFDLPARLFRTGRNTVELAAFLPLAEDRECIVPNHPARWLEFDPTSRISLTVEAVTTPLRLADFPMPFEALGDDNSTQITFVIPDEPSDHELNALAAVAFVLARDSTTQPRWSLTLASRFDPNALSGPAVIIGVAGRNPHLGSLSPADRGQAGWLSLTRPGWSEGEPVLAVSGPDGSAVLRAAHALADPLARLQMEGETAVVERLPPVELQPLPEQFTLADLGYGERRVRGAGEHSLIYTFDLPFAWTPGDGRLLLHFAHSAVLDPRVASLRVHLNGITVSDIRLDAPGSASNLVELSIPKALIRPGRNFLRLTFDFGLPVQLCDSGTAEGPWGTVRPDTKLFFPHAERGGRIDLDDFPYLFANPSDLANLTLILPAQSTDSDFADALTLVRVLTPSGRAPFPPQMARVASLDEGTKQRHLIILGDVSRQPLLRELNPYLHLPFDLETGALLPTYGIRVPTDLPDLGVVQLLRSPWAEKRAILVVSGTNHTGYSQALQLLIDPQLRGELSGQLALISADGAAGPSRVYVQSVADMGAVPGLGELDRLFRQFFGIVSPWPAIILIAVTLLVLAVISVLSLRWYRRRQMSASGAH